MLLMFAAMSRRKHKLSAAASRGVKGGTSRVFTSPARGALAISPSAQTRVDILECVITDLCTWIGSVQGAVATWSNHGSQIIGNIAGLSASLQKSDQLSKRQRRGNMKASGKRRRSVAPG